MALLEKLSGSCQGEKINVWPGSPGNWDRPPSTPHMQTCSHIPRSSPSSSPVIRHILPVPAHLVPRCDRARGITLLIFWLLNLRFPSPLFYLFWCKPTQRSRIQTWHTCFYLLQSAVEICFLRWSNQTFRLTKTPAVFKLTVPQLIPLTGRSVPSLSCLLPLLLSSHLVIRLFLYPSLTLDIYPHFSTLHNWCIWHRGPLSLSVSPASSFCRQLSAVSHHLAFLKLI